MRNARLIDRVLQCHLTLTLSTPVTSACGVTGTQISDWGGFVVTGRGAAAIVISTSGGLIMQR